MTLPPVARRGLGVHRLLRRGQPRAELPELRCASGPPPPQPPRAALCQRPHRTRAPTMRFGDIGTIFRELGWETRTLSGRVVPKTPNAPYDLHARKRSAAEGRWRRRGRRGVRAALPVTADRGGWGAGWPRAVKSRYTPPRLYSSFVIIHTIQNKQGGRDNEFTALGQGGGRRVFLSSWALASEARGPPPRQCDAITHRPSPM